MGDHSSMSISADSPSDETLNRGPLALLLRRQYEFPFGINMQFSGVFTPPRNRGGVIFSLQFVCVSVCLCVCVCVRPDFLVNKIPAERTRFSINGCLTQWLKPY